MKHILKSQGKKSQGKNNLMASTYLINFIKSLKGENVFNVRIS